MAAIELCIDGNGEFVTASTEDIPDLLASDYAFIWIDVDAGLPGELESLREHFDLHRIAVDDAMNGTGRARIVLFEDQIYVRSFGLGRDGSEVVAAPISLFHGARFLITVRSGDLPSLASIQERWREEVRHKREHATSLPSSHAMPTSTKLLYTVLDEIVDNYFAVVEGIADDVEALEDEVMSEGRSSLHIAIRDMRARINRVRRMLSPHHEVFNTLTRRDVPVVDEATIPYFADVNDHLLRCLEWLDTCRDQIASIVDLQQSVQANRLNRTMQTLTAWSIILMVCGVIAGIYGMNFDHMPELRWHVGYPGALALMVVISGSLALMFRRLDWW
jgi:magnesium transporter